MIEGKLSVFAQEPMNANILGQNFYRIRQPMLKLQEKDSFACALSSQLSVEDQETWINNCDIYVTQLATSQTFLDYMIFCREKGINKKFVIDWDDNPFYINAMNNAYFHYGLEEVIIQFPTGERFEFKDGKNGFNIEKNRKTLVTFGQCLKMADMVTCPSPLLSGFFKKFNKNTRVLKNLVNLSVLKPLHQVKDGFVRILWQGGSSHYEDLAEIQEAIDIVLNNNKNVKLVIFGELFPGVLKNINPNQIEHEKYVSIEVYPHKLRTINADIGIAPLKNDFFSTCKSELKWEEYSALEIPCIASNIPPYSLNIRHGRTGFLCSNLKEWVETLDLMIKKEELRKTIGRQARFFIEENYDLDKKVDDYEQTYKTLFSKELIPC